MAGTFRTAVAVISWENQKGATVFCDDGSLWEVHFTDRGPIWSDLKAPLPGSAAEVTEKRRADSASANELSRSEMTDGQRVTIDRY